MRRTPPRKQPSSTAIAGAVPSSSLTSGSSVQPFYDKKQVEEIKANLSSPCRGQMSSSDLQFMLDDMDAKFQILESQPAQEAARLAGALSFR